MIQRILLGAGLFLLGFYVGREIGRTEPIREELRKEREGQPRAEQLESRNVVRD